MITSRVDVAPARQTLPIYSGDALFSRQSGLRRGIRNPNYSGRWNWGAFFFSWLYLLSHGDRKRALVFALLDCIPIVGLFAHVYCGLRGSDFAFDARRFDSPAHYDAVQNAWRNWSILPLFIAVTAASLAIHAFAHRPASRTNTSQHAATAYAGRRLNGNARSSSSHGIPAHGSSVISVPVKADPNAQHLKPAATADTWRRAHEARQADVERNGRRAIDAAAADDAHRAKLADDARRAKLADDARRAKLADDDHRAKLADGARSARLADNARAGSVAEKVQPSFSACDLAVSAVHAASAAANLRDKLVASRSAIHFVDRCADKSSALQLGAMAFFEKAISDFGLDVDDWGADIDASIALQSNCALDETNVDREARAQCRAMVGQEIRIKQKWRLQVDQIRR